MLPYQLRTIIVHPIIPVLIRFEMWQVSWANAWAMAYCNRMSCTLSKSALWSTSVGGPWMDEISRFPTEVVNQPVKEIFMQVQRMLNI